MIRGLTVAALLLAVGSTTAQAQANRHGPGHVRPDSGKHHPHGVGHVRPDSATHSAMHAALHGNWTGALSSRGVSTGMLLSVARDSLRGVTFTVTTDQSKRGGPASDLVVGRDGQLRWTQDLSGTRCKASAILNAATRSSPEALTGKMLCDGAESTFTLKKTA